MTVTRTHLEQALTAEQLRITMIIRIVLMLGISFFYFVILLLYFLRKPDTLSQPDVSLMNMLSVIHAMITVVLTATAFFISKLPLRPERLAGPPASLTPEEMALQAVGLHRVSSLLLMAPIEGAAFIGAAICMIGVQNGTMALYPIYWLNAASAVLFVLVGIMTFPMRERVIEILESSFVQR
jgi:hypothetical protein